MIKLSKCYLKIKDFMMLKPLLDYIPKLKDFYGIVFIALISLVAIFFAKFHVCACVELSPLIISMVFGMLIGNIFYKQIPPVFFHGITYSLKKILRIAIVLLGFRITYQQIYNVGIAGFFVDFAMMVSTFLLAVWAGSKIFKLDRDTSILIGSGSAICGASAVLATESVLKSEKYKAALAVATVTIFGTLGMFLYPILYNNGYLPNFDSNLFGVYTGATIHEVAQVVAAGFEVSSEAGETSTIVKLTRVMMLAPLLIVLSFFIAKKTKGQKIDIKSVPIPWFVFVFIAASGINSLHMIPYETIYMINEFDTFLLAMAMGALGVETNIKKIKNAGLKPIYLATLLFVWLVVGGYFITLLFAPFA